MLILSTTALTESAQRILFNCLSQESTEQVISFCNGPNEIGSGHVGCQMVNHLKFEIDLLHVLLDLLFELFVIDLHNEDDLDGAPGKRDILGCLISQGVHDFRILVGHFAECSVTSFDICLSFLAPGLQRFRNILRVLTTLPPS